MRFPEFIDCPLSIDDLAELNYLIHDKAHISEGGIIVPLENAMKIHSKPMDTFLYRGVSQLEYDAIMSGKDLNMYQSFSEDIEIARRFWTNCYPSRFSMRLRLSIMEMGNLWT